ncbi:MAG: DUF7146 domain-containing protein [Brevundimonas sp.]|uniref:DUF7146 domain-containing protein n=1 Tax=Brevundimonas sp. TaxID=1871086 RepID=UPI0040334BC2
MTASNFAPRPAEITVREISAMLADRIESVCMALGLDGAKVNGALTPRNPTRNDRNPGSFVIMLHGPRQGRWDEYATGDFGDALDLVAYINFGRVDRTSKAEALIWAKRFLGVGDHTHMDPAHSRKLEAARREMEANTARAQRLADARQEKDRSSARAMVFGAQELAPGLPGWTYLRDCRRIPLETMARMPFAVRSHPGLKHTETGLIVPCLVSGMLLPGGAIAAAHRIFLQPDGSDQLQAAKAGGYATKKIWPRGWLGAVIPISRGETGLSTGDALKAGLTDECCYAEGVEDAFTGATLNPAWRTFAVGASRNFAEIDPPACARAVIVLRDRDPDRKVRAGVSKKVAVLKERCDARGLPFFETWPDRGFKDFNDMIRGVRA